MLCWCADLLGEDALTNLPLPAAEPAPNAASGRLHPPAMSWGCAQLYFLPPTRRGKPQPSVAPLVLPRVNLSAFVIWMDSLQTSLCCNWCAESGEDNLLLPVASLAWSLSLPSLPSAAPSRSWESALLCSCVAFPPLPSLAPSVALYPPLTLSGSQMTEICATSWEGLAVGRECITEGDIILSRLWSNLLKNLKLPFSWLLCQSNMPLLCQDLLRAGACWAVSF